MEMTRRTLLLRTTSEYGQERIRATIIDQRVALEQLTGRKTLTYRDLNALYALGIEVEWMTA